MLGYFSCFFDFRNSLISLGTSFLNDTTRNLFLNSFVFFLTKNNDSGIGVFYYILRNLACFAFCGACACFISGIAGGCRLSRCLFSRFAYFISRLACRSGLSRRLFSGFAYFVSRFVFRFNILGCCFFYLCFSCLCFCVLGYYSCFFDFRNSLISLGTSFLNDTTRNLFLNSFVFFLTKNNDSGIGVFYYILRNLACFAFCGACVCFISGIAGGCRLSRCFFSGFTYFISRLACRSGLFGRLFSRFTYFISKLACRSGLSGCLFSGFTCFISKLACRSGLSGCLFSGFTYFISRLACRSGLSGCLFSRFTYFIIRESRKSCVLSFGAVSLINFSCSNLLCGLCRRTFCNFFSRILRGLALAGFSGEELCKLASLGLLRGLILRFTCFLGGFSSIFGLIGCIFCRFAYFVCRLTCGSGLARCLFRRLTCFVSRFIINSRLNSGLISRFTCFISSFACGSRLSRGVFSGLAYFVSSFTCRSRLSGRLICGLAYFVSSFTCGSRLSGRLICGFACFVSSFTCGSRLSGRLICGFACFVSSFTCGSRLSRGVFSGFACFAALLALGRLTFTSAYSIRCIGCACRISSTSSIKNVISILALAYVFSSLGRTVSIEGNSGKLIFFNIFLNRFFCSVESGENSSLNLFLLFFNFLISEGRKNCKAFNDISVFSRFNTLCAFAFSSCNKGLIVFSNTCPAGNNSSGFRLFCNCSSKWTNNLLFTNSFFLIGNSSVRFWTIALTYIFAKSTLRSSVIIAVIAISAIATVSIYSSTVEAALFCAGFYVTGDNLSGISSFSNTLGERTRLACNGNATLRSEYGRNEHTTLLVEVRCREAYHRLLRLC